MPIKMKKSSVKYKDSSGNMQDIGLPIGGVETDATLTKSGVSADAKAVGDNLKQLSEQNSDLENRLETIEKNGVGSGGITQETDPTVPSWAKQPNKPTYTASEVGALPSTTTIPSKMSQLTNDKGYLTSIPNDIANHKDDNSMHIVYGVCDTAADVLDKVVTVDGNFVLKAGVVVIVKFTYANSIASPTLNVNGTGAKPMYRYGTTTMSTGTTTTGWVAGAIQMFTYDGTGWCRDYWNNTTYSNASLGCGYATCSTAAATAAKTASLSSYSLTTGGIVVVKFSNSVLANATLNINSKGAKAIYYKGAKITDGIIRAGDIVTFVYSSYYHLIAIDRWEDDIETLAEKKADKTSIPTKTSQLTNDSNFVTKDVTDALSGQKADKDDVPTKTSQLQNDSNFVQKSVTDIMSGQITTNKNDIAVLQKELEDLTSAKAEGNTLEEQLAWLDANGDRTKEYLLIDGNYYKCEVRTSDGETVPNFTNVLDTATLSLNKRFNSSDVLKDANGIVALDYVSVKVNDVIRFSKVSVLNGNDSGYQRVKYYNSDKTAIYKNDVQSHKALKITTDSDGVASYVVGYINNTSGNDATNALISNASTIAYTRMNLYIGSSAITQADVDDLIMTINEPIEYTTTDGGTEYVWVQKGTTSATVDYGKRVSALEETTVDHETRIVSLENRNTSGGSILDSMTVFAPSPQLPADGSDKADFNGENITCKQIYDYIDALVSKYPKYITKETLGKDQSGEFDWNRYTCCRRYYEAWQKQNYPKMYGWTNGSTTIYSTSVSPRIGDTLYTTKYIGTAKGTVSAVSNANQTRTVGGVVYTRDKTKDVEPTLIYSVMLTCKSGNSVYNSSKTKVTTISSITSTTLVGADGITYTRYPLGDRNADFVKPKVIVIGSNEHGRPLDPAEPAIISARMIKDLCECVNANNPFLNLLKNEYMVVFLPIINPWGYDQTHKSYYNSRGVNLDRNLDTPGWGNDTSNPQGEYGGSEAEMQYFMNTLVESGAKIVTANHALGTQTNSTGEGANSGRCHYMLGRNNSKYDKDLLAIAETMLANYNLFFTDYGQAPPESYAKTRSYIDWIGAEGGAVEMQAREGYVLEGNAQLHTARILEADYTLHLQFLHMLIKNAE